MKVLVIGTGAREHAIVHALTQDPTVEAVVAAPGNPGIDQVALCRDLPGGITDGAGIADLAEELGRERLEDCDLWVTLEPCAMCAGAITYARIARLYYAAPDPKGGAVEHGARVFAQPTCHHRPEVIAGLGEAEAAQLLRAFFAARR